MFNLLDITGNKIENRKALTNGSKNDKKLPVISMVDTFSFDNTEFLNSTFNMSLEISPKKEKILETESSINIFLNDANSSQFMIFSTNQGLDMSNCKKLSKIVSHISNIVLFNTWSQRIWSKESELFFESFFEYRCGNKIEENLSELIILINVQDSDESVIMREKISAQIKTKIDLLFKKAKKTNDISFSIEFNFLPHPKYEKDNFKGLCKKISEKIANHKTRMKSIRTFNEITISNLVEIVEKNNFEEEKINESVEEIIFSGTNGDDVVMIDSAFSTALRQSANYMAELTKSVDENNKIPGFGPKANEIMQNTLELFDNKVSSIEKKDFIVHKKQELEAIIDTSLSSIFLKQLSIIRELAIAHFKAATGNEDVPVDFAFFTADSFFVREAEDSVRTGSSWSYSAERTNVHNTIREISNRRKQLISEKIQHAEHQANAFQYLQMQQAQMQAIQQQQYGGGAGSWNIGAAYRPPDSNLNISMGYQQGRTNIQISMVPDEQASLLGPNGFTSGVGPANMGVSLNLNL
mmetsp:Transcript_149/g.259  ORF Transcript_149/g.259 Transcript_149/m.259 type:complete len:525 (+) Transcript_149:1109-2683(+)